MKRNILIFLISCTALYANAQNSQQVSTAEISFVFVSQDVSGTIEGFNSSSSIDLDNLANSKLKGAVTVETINTGNSIRNWSLRRGKYFDADEYPKISFESSSIQVDGADISVIGPLTIKGVTKEVTFKFTKTEKLLVGRTTLYSSDFGIQIKSEREKNKVTVKMVLHLK